MSELSLTELDAQYTELLPEREALGSFHGSFNHDHIYIHQSNTQIQAFHVHDSTQTAVNSVSVGDTVILAPPT